MAIYIHIEKTNEDSNESIYQYGFAKKSKNNEIVFKRVEGKISINKVNGDIQIVEVLNRENKEKNDFFLKRVSLVLKRHFKSNEFPETTYYIA